MGPVAALADVMPPTSAAAVMTTAAIRPLPLNRRLMCNCLSREHLIAHSQMQARVFLRNGITNCELSRA